MVSNNINKQKLAERIFNKAHKFIMYPTYLHLKFLNEETIDIPINQSDYDKIKLDDPPMINEIAIIALENYLQLLSDKEIEKLWFEMM